jgi:cardiolipin synthase
MVKSVDLDKHQDAKPKSVSVLTLPNFISSLRIVCGIAVFVLLILTKAFIVIAILAGVAGFTDFLDGYVARHTKTVTELGKIIDPVADRVLLIGLAIGIIVRGLIPIYFIVPVILREFLMSISTILLAIIKAKRIDVIWLGKAGTFGLMVAVPCFIIAGSVSNKSDFYNFYWVGYVVIIPAIILSWLATFSYAPKVLKAIKGRRTL